MAASQFTVYKKKEEDLDEYSDKGGARKKKATAAPGPAPGWPHRPRPRRRSPPSSPRLLDYDANCETGDR